MECLADFRRCSSRLVFIVAQTPIRLPRSPNLVRICFSLLLYPQRHTKDPYIIRQVTKGRSGQRGTGYSYSMTRSTSEEPTRTTFKTANRPDDLGRSQLNDLSSMFPANQVPGLGVKPMSSNAYSLDELLRDERSYLAFGFLASPRISMAPSTSMIIIGCTAHFQCQKHELRQSTSSC